MTTNKPIIIGACLILTLILGLVFTWPKYQDFWGLRSNVQAKEAEFLSQKQYLEQIRESAEQLDEYADSLNKISSALPQVPSLPSLFSFLQTSTSQTGLLLENIASGGASQGEINLNVSLNGDYQALKNFLLVLENSARIFEVENITLQSSEESGQPFSFAINMRTHFESGLPINQLSNISEVEKF